MFTRNGQAFGSVLRSKAQAGPDRSEAKPKPPTKAELQAQAAGLDLSTEGTKAELEARIAEATTGKGVSTDGDDGVQG